VGEGNAVLWLLLGVDEAHRQDAGAKARGLKPELKLKLELELELGSREFPVREKSFKDMIMLSVCVVSCDVYSTREQVLVTAESIF
jgi:hypothetical protein